MEGMNLDGLSEEDNRRMGQMMETMQMKDRVSDADIFLARRVKIATSGICGWRSSHVRVPRGSRRVRSRKTGSSWAPPKLASVQSVQGQQQQQRMGHEAPVTRHHLRMYNFLVEKCFNHCIEGFRRKTLDKTEETCVKRCAEKFLKSTTRVSMRFAELQSDASSPDDPR